MSAIDQQFKINLEKNPAGQLFRLGCVSKLKKLNDAQMTGMLLLALLEDVRDALASKLAAHQDKMSSAKTEI